MSFESTSGERIRPGRWRVHFSERIDRAHANAESIIVQRLLERLDGLVAELRQRVLRGGPFEVISLAETLHQRRCVRRQRRRLGGGMSV